MPVYGVVHGMEAEWHDSEKTDEEMMELKLKIIV